MFIFVYTIAQITELSWSYFFLSYLCFDRICVLIVFVSWSYLCFDCICVWSYLCFDRICVLIVFVFWSYLCFDWSVRNDWISRMFNKVHCSYMWHIHEGKRNAYTRLLKITIDWNMYKTSVYLSMMSLLYIYNIRTKAPLLRPYKWT